MKQSFQSFLKNQAWNNFTAYPKQGYDIYIHCMSSDGHSHKFYRISHFDAMRFDPSVLKNKLRGENGWRYGWLYAEMLESLYEKITGIKPEIIKYINNNNQNLIEK